MSTLGNRLRASRERKGWKQKYVCDKLGLSSSTMSGYEHDYREPDAETLSKLADLYEVSVDFLVNGLKTVKVESNDTIELEKLLTEVNARILYKGVRLTESEKQKVNDVLKLILSDSIQK